MLSGTLVETVVVVCVYLSPDSLRLIQTLSPSGISSIDIVPFPLPSGASEMAIVAFVEVISMFCLLSSPLPPVGEGNRTFLDGSRAESIVPQGFGGVTFTCFVDTVSNSEFMMIEVQSQ
jgi:hypothetical protein